MQKNSNAAIFAIRPEYAKSILDGTKNMNTEKWLAKSQSRKC
ncbi:hypothetical protein [Anaerostipes hadrus]|nr:hypothetical protein [Anaerostipes hadrus]